MAASDTVLTSYRVGETDAVPHPSFSYSTTTETFRTSAFAMNPGDVIFTNKDETVLQFPNPGGKYAITGFAAELVDEWGQSVPLSEVYLHHWLVFHTDNPNLGVCGDWLNYSFGVGAESRTSPVVLPEGHGYVVDSRRAKDNHWTLNLHALRTEGLRKSGSPATQAQAVKDCIECNYAAEKEKICKYCTNWTSGTFQCCLDGNICPTDGSVSGTKNYALQYKVTYTKQVSAVVPLYFFLLDASNCMIEHNIPANNQNPTHITHYSWKAPINSKLVMATGHIHIGGIDISLYINGELQCTTTSHYGTDPANPPGNEKGYLVAANTCYVSKQTKVGDNITVRSQYWVGTESDPLNTALPPGNHNGVMDYMYLAVVRDSITYANGTAVDLRRSKDIVFETAEHPENLLRVGNIVL